MPSLPGSVSRSNAAAASRAGKTRSTSARDPARCEVRNHLAGEGAHRRRFLVQRPGAQHRPEQARPPAHQLPEVERRLGAGARADDHDPSLHRQSQQIGVEVRRRRRARARRRRHPLPARARRARPGRSPSPRARRRPRGARAERTVASTRAPAAAAICTAAVPTPPFAPLTSSSSPGRSAACVITASCAVTNASGTAAAASSSSCSGTPVTWSSCTSTWSASPPPPTRPNTRSPGANRRAVGPQASTVPDDLDSRDVRRRARGSRVVPVPLGDVGGVQTRIADGDENLVARRRRRRALLEGDDLVAACTGEDDRAHASSGAYATPSGPGRYRAACQVSPIPARSRRSTCSQQSVPASRATSHSRGWSCSGDPRARSRPTGGRSSRFAPPR